MRAKKEVAALCPNAEVTVFRAPREGGIEEARSGSGEPYMRVPNALGYRTAYNPSCSCKKPDEGWAQALRKAESLIEHRKGEVLVTEAISQQRANAMLRQPKARRERVGRTAISASTARPVAVPEPVATGSIGRNPAPPSGPGKAIRVIAPDIIPVPRP